MSDNSESFVFYESFLKGIELLPEEEQLKAFKLIAQYGIRGELPEGEQTLANAIFVMAQPNIDASKEKRSNGKKGGRPSKETEKPEVTEEESHGYENEKPMVIENEKPMVIENENHRLSDCESNVDVNVNVNGNVNVNDNVNVNGDKEREKGAKTNSRFSPPTLEQVQAYIAEQGLKVDAQYWYDHYVSNGWMVGKAKMKDWKASLRKWHHNEVDKVRPSPPSGVQQKFKPEGRDLAFLEK